MQNLLIALTTHPWVAVLAIAGVAVALLLLLRRSRVRRRAAVEAEREPYPCFTIRLIAAGLLPYEVPGNLPDDTNVPAVWRKGPNKR